MSTRKAPTPRRPPTWDQPVRAILRRWREGATTWVLFECGHEDTATGLDLASSLRCRWCNPVPRPTFEQEQP